MFCAYTRPRYQVSVYMTIGPLVRITDIVDSTNGAIGSLKNDQGYVGIIGVVDYQWYTNGIIQYTPLVESET